MSSGLDGCMSFPDPTVQRMLYSAQHARTRVVTFSASAEIGLSKMRNLCANTPKKFSDTLCALECLHKKVSVGLAKTGVNKTHFECHIYNWHILRLRIVGQHYVFLFGGK